MTEVAPRFKERPGGYTRILKLGSRAGDKAAMAYIEWVDFAPKVKTDATEAAGALAAKKTLRAAELKKKRVRKLQEQARRTFRAHA